MNKAPTTKLCKRCGRELPFDAFYFKGTHWSSYCIECSRKERRDYYRASKDVDYVLVIRHYTQQEIDFVTANYMQMPYRKIAAQLGRTKQAIANLVNKLGLHKNQKRN